MNKTDYKIIKATIHEGILVETRVKEIGDSMENMRKVVKKLLPEKIWDKIMDDLYPLPKQKWYDTKNDSTTSWRKQE